MEHKIQDMDYRIRNIIQRGKEKPRFSVPGSIFYMSSSKGFSIIETIVAIAILSVALAAPLTLAQRGLNSAVYARDQVAAFFLAQEAIEYVHNIRDNNNYTKVNQAAWLSGLSNC